MYRALSRAPVHCRFDLESVSDGRVGFGYRLDSDAIILQEGLLWEYLLSSIHGAYHQTAMG